MLNTSLFPNNVNGAGTSCEGTSSGRCSSGEQQGPGRYPMTARMRWSKEVNRVMMECFYRSKPSDEEGRPIRGYRQRMFRQWRLRGMLSLQNNMYVTRQGPLERMGGHQSMN